MPKAQIKYVSKSGTAYQSVKEIELDFVPRVGEVIHDPESPNAHAVHTYMVQSVIYHVNSSNTLMPLITARSCFHSSRLETLQEYCWIPEGTASDNKVYDEQDLEMYWPELMVDETDEVT